MKYEQRERGIVQNGKRTTKKRQQETACVEIKRGKKGEITILSYENKKKNQELESK